MQKKSYIAEKTNTMSRKKSLLHRLSDISKIHHRAAFTDVEKHTAPQKSDFLRLASERYSCRAFTEAPVSDKHLSSILEAARLAPTAQDRQPVHIWVFKSAVALFPIGHPKAKPSENHSKRKSIEELVSEI